MFRLIIGLGRSVAGTDVYRQQIVRSNRYPTDLIDKNCWGVVSLIRCWPYCQRLFLWRLVNERWLSLHDRGCLIRIFYKDAVKNSWGELKIFRVVFGCKEIVKILVVKDFAQKDALNIAKGHFLLNWDYVSIEIVG
jgi:hypothetical protein